MTLIKTLLSAMLVLGLLLPPGVVAAAGEGVQSTTDEKGTIRIGNTGPAAKEKAGDAKSQGKAGEPKTGADKAATAPAAQAFGESAPGLMPPTSRRPYGPAAERRKAIRERRLGPQAEPGAPTPQAPPAGQPGQLPALEPTQK